MIDKVWRAISPESVVNQFMAALVALTIVSSSPARLVAQAQVAASNPAPAAVDTGYVNYDDGPISLPLGIGLRIPAYDRVNGLSLPWGPFIQLAADRIQLDPTITYRSHLGEVDPALTTRIRLGQHGELEIRAARGTFTNDSWLRSGIVNSAAAFGVGSDARNYFRADRVTAGYTHDFVRNELTITPRVGGLYENAWSTGSAVPHTSAPWSVLGRTGSLKMRRINPAILSGHIASATAGLNLAFERGDFLAAFDGGVETAFDAPLPLPATPPGIAAGEFTQLTIHSAVSFLTFGLQRFRFSGHAVLTPGDPAPPQRFAYLGSGGSLATVDLLALGGDHLLFVEGEYTIPLKAPMLPFVGPPMVSARYAAGSAGTGRIPDLIQNLSFGVAVRALKAEVHIDPNYRKTRFSEKTRFSIGVSL